mmetsp:Transcript_12551/g.23547  ORF Transcript_12551/g.23547 Transcript_12551/m.23547 type:complete len:219 (-) Transcript_12551:1840-2496(-)
MLNKHRVHFLPDVNSSILSLWSKSFKDVMLNLVTNVNYKMETIDIVHNSHIESGRNSSFLVIPSNSEVSSTSLVYKLFDKVRYSVECENDGFFSGENTVKMVVRQSVRVQRLGNKLHEIHNIYESDLETRDALSHNTCCCQCFQCWNITCASHDNVRFTPFIVRCPIPNTKTSSTVTTCFLHSQPLRGWVLSTYNNVNLMASAEAVVEHGKKTVGIRG